MRRRLKLEKAKNAAYPCRSSIGTRRSNASEAFRGRSPAEVPQRYRPRVGRVVPWRTLAEKEEAHVSEYGVP